MSATYIKFVAGVTPFLINQRLRVRWQVGAADASAVHDDLHLDGLRHRRDLELHQP